MDDMCISIILSKSWNPGLLDATLESVQAQTSRAWELIRVNAERNAGVALARAPFLLFLESGDLLHPEHLARMEQALVCGEGLDAVLCGWRYVDAEGHEGPPHLCPIEEDLFPLLASRPLFPAGACLVRKSQVEEVGGFDSDLPVCGAWALWQRISRSGAHFGRLPDPLAGCRLRPEGQDPEAMLLEGLEVIARAHVVDPRVPSPAPIHAKGRPPTELVPTRLRFAAWCAGLALGRGSDPRAILGRLGGPAELMAGGLDPGSIARAFEQAIPQGAGRTEDAWGSLWPKVVGRLDGFLALVEDLTRVRRLGRRVRSVLERRAVPLASARPIDLGRLRAVHWEVTEPLADLAIPSRETEYLRCDLTLEGELLGAVELPVVGDRVSAAVLADAVAAAFAQPVAERFQMRSGWTPDWERLLEEIRAPGDLPTESPRDGWLSVDVNSPLPGIEAAAPFHLAVHLAGAALGVLDLPAGSWSPGVLWRAIERTAGLELRRTAVREGLLGQPLDGAGSLSERLAASAGRRSADARDGSGVVLARHPGRIGTAASRRADLPTAALEDLLASAEAAGEPIARVSMGEQVAYAPDLLWSGCGEAVEEPPEAEASPAPGRLPILLYHSVAPDGPFSFERYRVSPEKFEEHLEYLRDLGCHTPRLDDWGRAAAARRPLPGRPVLLTFDDGYRDFALFAWPLLRRYGFGALVFLVAERVGKTSRWDDLHGEPVPLLGWEEIQTLRDEGVEFGSHSATHPPLTGLSPAEVTQEAARSRALLTRGIGHAVDAFAYPHGDYNPAIVHLVGACGYVYGFTCQPGAAGLDDTLMALPRIEVAGGDGATELAGKLAW